jgi:hypothetical protein
MSDDNPSNNYLISIFDPISAEDNPLYFHPGMGQWGAQCWAIGLNDAGDPS